MIGAGAIGGFFAGQLLTAGTDVTIAARRPFARLVVHSETLPVDVAATVVTDPAAAPDGPFDVLVVAVKTVDLEGVAPWLARWCGPDTVVLGLQNGLGAEDVLGPLAGPATVVPAVIHCAVEATAPGHVVHHQQAHLALPAGEAAARIASAFAPTAVGVVVGEDFVTERWRKLGLNVVGNGLTALTDRSVAASLGDPRARGVVQAAIEECWAVAVAEGADLGPDDVAAFLQGLDRLPDDFTTSMAQDRRRGRPFEHEAIHGAVVRRARAHGIPTPTVDVLHTLLTLVSPDVVSPDTRSPQRNDAGGTS